MRDKEMLRPERIPAQSVIANQFQYENSGWASLPPNLIFPYFEEQARYDVRKNTTKARRA